MTTSSKTSVVPFPTADASPDLSKAEHLRLVTEEAVVGILARTHGGRFRYCHSSGSWFVWRGSHWARDMTDQIIDECRALAQFHAEGQDSHVRRMLGRASTIFAVERLARSDRTFAITAAAWDRDPMLLATPGGTIDLGTGELRPADPIDALTKCTAVSPSVGAACPRWTQFLKEITGGDGALIRFLQQFAGYCLTGSTKEQALLFIYGSGGNGKSVFLNVLSGILGDYAAVASMDTFTASKGDRHPTDVAMLAGARLVTASETEAGRAWAEARIKALTGGEPITARFMRQDNFTFRPTFKILIVGNHRPILNNVDDAARRRFNIVPFDKKPTRPDPNLEEALRREWPEILRWMVEGCLDWQKNGLVRPESVTAATTEYFDVQDDFAHWLEESCEVDPSNPGWQETTAALWESWCAYAAEAETQAGNKRSFSEKLGQHGVQRRRMTGGTRAYIGIRLGDRKRLPYDSDTK